ncbi:cell division transport system ATP-binding protein [Dysgonomonas sp. PFB1-18]|uniref:cell division ATP-binding protein FtsE n=1 Tax=unclassified Dysgonomonas TaxID=2630389 RepID=UPI0024767862|nr:MULTISPECIES: ATP-binding cassette domain-containing protein [unclassified Dysgonomonas]MDH6309712.1 cell division transport system ATP-binding protein [Dysgonomonas sp. PF1-14]MDH6339280.1 cell division transport system ATP-binding protein [Dysgonomonas sp. PF1-16]MDH6380779.1 cell division transport system ATP-binding protein [Dysgonomonas sp. PFB1-18]MDH6398275.1 cell division transport system ATP-binding protein [Dysgonomonas sp. PF1-23]
MDTEKDVILKYKDVDLGRDGNIILSDINISISEGDFVYLIGKVGSGKSTFLKSVYYEIPLSKGHGRIFDYELESIKKKQIPHLRRKVGIVFQDFQLLIDRTAEKNLEFVLRATGWKNKGLIDIRINEVLTQVGMQNKGYKMPHELSGGEQQRIVIARALLNSPEIILADEPTGNLDPETGNQIVQLLHTISESGTAVVMSTHNYAVVQKYPGRIIKCEDGHLRDVKLNSQTN